MKGLKINAPINQTELFGYGSYFNLFKNLYVQNNLPNVILLSGPKGSGKCTFSYHIINYILSQKEEKSYSLNNFSINSANISYKKLCNNTHPNFFLLEKDSSNDVIKIENIRKALKFLNKTTYSSNIKILLTDGVEYLNKNSSNALLKALEEANNKTYFLIIHNNAYHILNTIKSRCVEFKFFFKINEKKVILNELLNHYYDKSIIHGYESSLLFETPGNILKYLAYFEDSDFNFLDDKILALKYLFDKYKVKKDNEIFPIIFLIIELFYNDLAIKNIKYINLYIKNKITLIKSINDSIKFNLDKKILFLSLEEALQNEQR